MKNWICFIRTNLTGSAVSITNEELDLLRSIPDTPVVIFVVAPTGTDTGEGDYRVVAELTDWDPAAGELAPSVWSLPIDDTAATEPIPQQIEVLEIEEIGVGEIGIEEIGASEAVVTPAE